MKDDIFTIEDKRLDPKVFRLIKVLGISWPLILYVFYKYGFENALIIIVVFIPAVIVLLVYFNRETYRITKIGEGGLMVIDLDNKKTTKICWDEVEDFDIKWVGEDQYILSIRTKVFLAGFYEDCDFQKRTISDNIGNQDSLSKAINSFKIHKEKRSYKRKEKKFARGEALSKTFLKNKKYLDRLKVPDKLRADPRLREKNYKKMHPPLKIKRKLSPSGLIIIIISLIYLTIGFLNLTLGLLINPFMPKTLGLYLLDLLVFLSLLLLIFSITRTKRPYIVYSYKIKLINKVFPLISKSIRREDLASVSCFYYDEGKKSYKLKSEIEIILKNGKKIIFKDIKMTTYSYLDYYLFLDDFIKGRL